MIGLIHVLLFDLIEAKAGPDGVREVKRRAEVPADRQFRIDQPYDDEEWRRLFTATGTVLGVTPEQAEVAFAGHFYRDSQKRWPMWFAMSANARSFLERQPRIHNGFATGVLDAAEQRAINEKFELERRPEELVMHYRSPNRLCGLYKELARCILRHYGEEADIQEPRCLKSGDAECEVRVRWN
ncbi:MAG: hypothetical protein HOP29_07645 [Phycisphaerales bacterium]|nr:hypothetical protein [Phycisphaerales bacterium]